MELNISKMELILARFFNYRQHMIVPNVSWGFHIHECDLFIITKAHYAYEVEIKISKQDLKNDLKKRHMHEDNRIRKLFFAIPEELNNDYIKYIPERAGIIVVNDNRCAIEKAAKTNKAAKKLTDQDCINISRLGVLRYWKLRGLDF